MSTDPKLVDNINTGRKMALDILMTAELETPEDRADARFITLVCGINLLATQALNVELATVGKIRGEKYLDDAFKDAVNELKYLREEYKLLEIEKGTLTNGEEKES